MQEGEGRDRKKSNQQEAMLRKSTSWAADDVGSQTRGWSARHGSVGVMC